MAGDSEGPGGSVGALGGGALRPPGGRPTSHGSMGGAYPPYDPYGYYGPPPPYSAAPYHPAMMIPRGYSLPG